MHRIDTPTAQKDKFGAGKNGFTRGNPQTGVPATDLDDDYFDAIQEELAGLVEAGNLTLDKSDRGQVLKALKLLFTANTDSMGALAALVGAANKLPYFTGPKAAALADLTAFAREILAQTDAAGVLSKLGLGAGAPPIGIPFFWPSSAMPNTVMPEWADMVFLKLNDATFSATTYPKLALVWPGLKLTDTRGEFIRICDDGRGVDSGRALLSAQLDALQQMTGTARNGSVTGFINTLDNNVTGVFKKGTEYANTAQNTSATKGADLVFDASLVARTASETRPRNIAFNLLVRAK